MCFVIIGFPLRRLFSLARKWIEEDISYLIDSIGKVKVSTIARNLNRTETAVLLKLKRLGFSNTKDHVGMLTFGELSRFLGVDRKIVQGWAERHNLPFTSKVTRTSKYYYFVDNEDFWAWAWNNREKIDFSKIEENTILPEPDWVKKERYYNTAFRKRQYKLWSYKEDKKLKEMLEKKGYSYRQAGEVLGRSAISVERRYARI